MMRCGTVKELLEAYIEGELDESKQKAVEAHISSCESCKQELALTRSIPRLVSSLAFNPPVPEDIIPNTLKQIREAPTARWQWLRSFGAFLSRRWQLTAIGALVLAALLFGISYQRMHSGSEMTEAEVAAAAEDIKLALGIVSAATQDVQLVALTEGARALDLTRSKSRDTMRTLSRTQSQVLETLRRNLAVLAQL
jgi:anti-sigma factor RsiW